jgi:decaprenylphospho-beta-D-erythro-pentofuranosid-2-ulose 2-reductase
MPVAWSKVIVVGASSGIGAAMARQLAARGSQVAAVARREDALAALAAASGGRIRGYAFDTTRFEDVPDLFERIAADLGGVDAIVYAAGVNPRIVEHEYAFDKDWRMADVNFIGGMAWLSVAAARFEAARAGTIVGISSIAGERGRRTNPGYTASKAAFTAYVEALRNRCSRYGVNVVTAKPGFVDTAMTRDLPGLFWLISAEDAARRILALGDRGASASGFVPRRWALVAFVVRHLPSFIFRRLNF